MTMTKTWWVMTRGWTTMARIGTRSGTREKRRDGVWRGPASRRRWEAEEGEEDVKDEEGEEERRTRPRSLEAALSPLPSPIGERERCVVYAMSLEEEEVMVRLSFFE